MSYPTCKHGHSHEMIPCPTCESEKTVASLRAQLETQTKWLESNSDTISAAEGEVAALRREVEGLKARVELAEKRNDEDMLEIDSLARSRDTALAQLAEAIKERDALRQLVWNPDEGENDRFERIGEMYHADTGYLRPGKSDPTRDSNSQENRDRFTLWLRNKHLAAIDAAGGTEG